MLQCRVLSFGLLSDDDAVYILVPGLDIRQRFYVDHVGIQVQGIAKLHVQGLELSCVGEVGGCQDSLELEVVLLDR